MADVEAAIAAVPDWIARTSWTGPGVKMDELHVSGHSNGAQGVWFFLAHRPDLVRSAAVVSGYSSIQAYVPYVFWREMQPRIKAVLDAVLSNFRHELLYQNFESTSILVQHGSNDDNVPVFHARRMNELLQASRSNSHFAELKHRGHWFEGVMTTKPMKEYYSNLSEQSTSVTLPSSFRFLVPHSHDMGSRFGILVDQLLSPDRFGSIQGLYSRLELSLAIQTSNVRRFHLVSRDWGGKIESVEIDGVPLPLPPEGHQSWFVCSKSGAWTVSQKMLYLHLSH